MEKETPSVIRKRVIAGAIAMGTVLGSAGVASAWTAQDTTTPDPSAAQTDSTDDGLSDGADDETGDNETDDNEDGEHGTEELLTGSTADQVTAAALEAVPGGTIDRVETDDHGAAYEAHMTDADGNPVTVTFDESFAVVEIQAGKGGDHDGKRGDRDNHTPLTAEQDAAVTAAAETAVPGGTVTKTESEDDGFEAHVTDADGNEVEVIFDADMNVLEIGAED